MRLLFVQDSLGAGGAEKSNLLFWEYLLNKNIEFKVILLKKVSTGFEKETKQLGVDYKVLSGNNPIKKYLELRKIFQVFKPNIIQSVLYKSSIYSRLANFNLKSILLESLVNNSYDKVRLADNKVSNTAFYFYKYLDRFTIFLVDYLIPITENVKNHYLNNFNVPNRKFKVIFRGRHENILDKVEERKKIADNLGKDSNKVWLLQVGRQEFQKGHIHTLKALQLLPDNIKSQIEVLFLGREGNASATLKSFLKDNGLDVNYHFLGHRSDVQQFMKASDVFLFPSLYEGLGGSLIEAQAAELPITCSNLPVFNEVVEKGKNAVMFEAGNEQEFAKKIQELVENPELRKEMGKHSLERFNNHFQIDKIHEEMVEFYDSVLTANLSRSHREGRD